jgi:hypothetical protein
MQGDITRRLCERVIDKRTRKPHPPVITGNGTNGRHIFHARFRRLTEANFHKDLIDGVIYGLDRSVIKRTILPACKARPDGTQLFGERSGTVSPARCTAT